MDPMGTKMKPVIAGDFGPFDRGDSGYFQFDYGHFHRQRHLEKPPFLWGRGVKSAVKMLWVKMMFFLKLII